MRSLEIDPVDINVFEARVDKEKNGGQGGVLYYLPVRCPCNFVLQNLQQYLEVALQKGIRNGVAECRSRDIKLKYGRTIVRDSVEDARAEFIDRVVSRGRCTMSCCLRFLLAFPFEIDLGPLESSDEEKEEDLPNELSCN